MVSWMVSMKLGAGVCLCLCLCVSCLDIYGNFFPANFGFDSRDCDFILISF